MVKRKLMFDSINCDIITNSRSQYEPLAGFALAHDERCTLPLCVNVQRPGCALNVTSNHLSCSASLRTTNGRSHTLKLASKKYLRSFSKSNSSGAQPGRYTQYSKGKQCVLIAKKIRSQHGIK